MESMLTVEEVKELLDIDQKKLESYVRQKKLHAYKIGGTYLRFRKEEAINLHFEIRPQPLKKNRVTFFSRVSDFWRFNNFYIVSLLVVIALAVILLQF